MRYKASMKICNEYFDFIMPQKQISTEFQPTMPSTDNIPTASTNKLKA